MRRGAHFSLGVSTDARCVTTCVGLL